MLPGTCFEDCPDSGFAGGVVRRGLGPKSLSGARLFTHPIGPASRVRNTLEDQASARFHDHPLCEVPGARHIAVGPQGKILFVGTLGRRFALVTNDAASGPAGEVSEFVSATR